MINGRGEVGMLNQDGDNKDDTSKFQDSLGNPTRHCFVRCWRYGFDSGMNAAHLSLPFGT